MILTPERRKRAMTFIFITVFLDMVGFGIIIPVVPSLLQDVGHVDLSQAAIISGWMFAGYSLAQFAFGPVMGNLSDAYGRRPLLLLAIGGLMVDYVFSALAPSVGYLYVGRIVAGLCGASYVIANAFIADITEPEDRAGAFGMMGAAFGIGFVVGPAIGGLLGEFGPRVPFWAAAVVSGINLVFGYFVLPESLPVEKRRKFDWRRSNPFGAFKVYQSYPTVLPLTAVLAVFFFASSVYPAIWPFWGKAQFGWSDGMIGLTLAAFGIIQAVTQGGLSGPLAKWMGEHAVARLGLIVAVIAAVGYGFADSLPFVLIFLVIHAPEGLVHPMVTAIMSKEVPDDAQGELQGGLSAIINITMLFGTLFYSRVFAYATGPNVASPMAGATFWVAAGLLLAALILFLVLDRRRTPAVPAVSENL